MSLFESNPSTIRIIFFTTVFILLCPALARNPHIINFRSPNLYPEGIAWDPSAQHFLVGSLHHRTINSISDAGVVQTLISDPTLPVNTSILGLTVDRTTNRLLAAVHSDAPLPPFNALAAYDLRTRERLFLSILQSPNEDTEVQDGIETPTTRRQVANDVAVDFKGNAYVTNSAGNFIWKVNANGESSIFSRSPLFTRYPIDPNDPYNYSGLNGIAYISKGYLLVVQTNTGKMFKVDADDGTARLVLLPEELTWVDGMAVRKDGVVLAVSHKKLWFLKSDDSWGEGVVYDKIALDEEGFASSVIVGAEDRVYVLYGHVLEGTMGKVQGREVFRIEEVRSEKESGGQKVWILVMVGLGLAYFLFWRFQMKQLVTNMDKKTN
ncbi:hypothetical protein SLEP1_g11110 [Rubroshorea leprosula]|uniref:SMP-30/Gluconolactonase/LRE-like region domain-containing protein n=1 Tax=Rubroshorea leprosula TaxID=152421 RepID=A0AAV5IA93_9ROSI|nr:hypothetical protein SLEP1_g11110 [Rubroshorea leprosula]